jgi:hypothetical protein
MARRHLPVVLSAAALVVALSATSPGLAALQGGVRVALFAKNAAKVGGIGASKKPKPGKLLPLGKTLSTVDSNGIEGEYSAITLEIDGLGVISYYDGGGATQDLKVAHCANVTCSSSSIVPVDTPGQVGWNTSITIGSDGLPFVSYRDVTNNRVRGLHCPNAFCVGYLRRR